MPTTVADPVLASHRDFYGALGDDYDLLVPWEDRLAREHPFFAQLFQEHEVRSVLDLACGTGGHTLAFQEWGYQATGVDASADMLAIAERKAAERRSGAQFYLGDMRRLGQILPPDAGPFDAAVCLGNSYPHLTAERDLDIMLTTLREYLRPDGLLILHQLNYSRILAQKDRFLPLRNGQSGDEEVVLVRFYDFPHRSNELLRFNILALHKRNGSWESQLTTTPIRPYVADQVLELLRGADYSEVQIYGGFDFTPYNANESPLLVTVACRR